MIRGQTLRQLAHASTALAGLLWFTTSVASDEPVTTLQTTVTTTTRVVSTKPVPVPPLRQEVITTEPSQAHVWVPGSWERQPDKWNWMPGRWEKPPFQNARYVPGYWKYDQNQYEWNTGHWATATQGVVVARPLVPPPTFHEPVPKPTTVVVNQAWVPGHWNWNGVSWVWSPGFYAVPPAPRTQWVAGHWRQGLLGAWRWTPGHWVNLP